MEEEKKLYPIRFSPLHDEYCWGSETFEVADLGYRDSLVSEGWLAGNLMSEVMDTYLDRVVGDNVYEYFGRQFPICVRTVRCHGKMPLRVHPDDTVASERYDLLGKEKLWYVLRCGRSARVLMGFREDADASSVIDACSDGSVADLINVIAPHKGQYFHIAPGTPHALEGDIEVLEISESSPADVCMCSWGQMTGEEEFDPSLNLIEALDYINFDAWKAENPGLDLINISQMRVRKLQFSDRLDIRPSENDTFVLYSCIDGEMSVDIDVAGSTVPFAVRAGETVLVPAECREYRLSPLNGGVTVLETTVPFRIDEFLNPKP